MLIKANPEMISSANSPKPAEQPVPKVTAVDGTLPIASTLPSNDSNRKFELKAGRGFWAAVVLVVITFIYFALHSRSLNHKLISSENKISELTELMRQMVTSQKELTQKLESMHGDIVLLKQKFFRE
jgi:hypothetical protein